MFDLPPSLESGTSGAAPSPVLRVDPVALAQVAGALTAQAEAMRSGAPALQSAWIQASSELSSERTGAVLAEARPAAAVVLDEFMASVESLARTLRSSALTYAQADAAAIPDGSGAVDAWMHP